MGDVMFLSLLCEAYAEIGVAIKKQSPSPQTVFAAYEGADVIYVAAAASYRPPVSMEVFNSPFGPQAADILIAQAGSILKELAAGLSRESSPQSPIRADPSARQDRGR